MNPRSFLLVLAALVAAGLVAYTVPFTSSTTMAEGEWSSVTLLTPEEAATDPLLSSISTDMAPEAVSQGTIRIDASTGDAAQSGLSAAYGEDYYTQMSQDADVTVYSTGNKTDYCVAAVANGTDVLSANWTCEAAGAGGAEINPYGTGIAYSWDYAAPQALIGSLGEGNLDSVAVETNGELARVTYAKDENRLIVVYDVSGSEDKTVTLTSSTPEGTGTSNLSWTTERPADYISVVEAKAVAK